MKYIPTITLILAATAFIHAQNIPDYVITTKGDTIAGKVKPLTFGPDKKVMVTDANKKKTTLTLFQTKAYYLKGERYEPVRSEKGYTFMKVVKSGYLSLYGFQIENQATYDGQFLQKKDGHGTEVPNLTFKKVMTRFLSDVPEVASQVESGELGKKELEQIVDLYNVTIENKSKNQQKVIAEKKEQLKGIAAWDALEQKIKANEDFESKSNALEMITDIKNKVRNGEKIPNFLSEALKTSLQKTTLTTELETLLNSN